MDYLLTANLRAILIYKEYSDSLFYKEYLDSLIYKKSILLVIYCRYVYFKNKKIEFKFSIFRKLIQKKLIPLCQQKQSFFLQS
jgi:hypothetical protein